MLFRSAVALGIGRAAVHHTVTSLKKSGARPGAETTTPHWALADGATDVEAARAALPPGFRLLQSDVAGRLQELPEGIGVVVDPDLHRDIVSLGFVKNVEIEEGKVSFTIELTTPACPVREQLQTQAEEAVRALPGVSDVVVEIAVGHRPCHDMNRRTDNEYDKQKADM